MRRNIGGLIIEGADQQGKSYVCDKLHGIMRYPVHHFSRPTADTDFAIEYLHPLVKYDMPVIFDRSYVSEMVYGKLFRFASGITPAIKEYVEDVLCYGFNYVLVYVKRKNYKWIERSEMYTAKDNDRVIAEYDEVYPTINMPKMQVDSFDADSIEQILDFYKKNNPEYAG